MDHNSLMLSDGNSAFACPSCGAGGALPPNTSDIHCGVCGGSSFLRRCKKCKKPSIMTPAITGPSIKAWKCLSCNRSALRGAWKPATWSEFIDSNPQWLSPYDSVGIPVSVALSDPQRRRIDGSILNADGILGIATGGSTIIFDKVVATLMIGDMSNPIAIPYEEMVSLQFTGRGQLTTTTGGGWVGGGYGLTGALHGAALARAMNLMTTKTITTNETIVHFEWRGGQVTLLNTTFLPMQMATFLEPVVARISAIAQHAPAMVESASSPTASNFTQQLKSLTELHISGALTDEEFSAAKAHLLNS